ncbi:capsule assembly Wzi family protein [Dyadobacter crusticola]|uniref:capsule assembly Wzi family protein n=1 Tax=Dyadobacter crusticola TaxID=292407 RepID=UPI000690D795|nr:capsule assembly Wzi family protein [Dyadobacter crusticola]
MAKPDLTVFFKVLVLVTLLLWSQNAPAQDSTSANKIPKRTTEFKSEVGILASTLGNTPFWLHANQFGIVPLHNPVVLAGASIKSDYRGKTWDLGYGAEVWASLGKRSAVVVTEAYIKAKLRKLEIWGGRRKQIIGIVGDSVLTSGSYIQSGNSVPIPQIQIGFTDYIRLFKDIFSFKVMLSHGWFDANRIVKNHYLHQKFLYIKLGKPKWPVRFAGGFNHNVQWGGTVIMPNRYTVGKNYPSDLLDYWYVFSGKRIPTFGFVDPTKYDAIDRGNRVGNHLGSIDFSLEASIRSTTLVIYRQFLYDDGSLYYRKGFKDGLNGLSLKFNGEKSSDIQINAVTAEFLYTVDQGGSAFTLDGGPRGRDDYFNHVQYSGWLYDGSTIGTPFIVPKEQTDDLLPRNSIYKYSNNTRVKLFHLGVSGKLSNISFVYKMSFSENKGTYEKEFPGGTNQLSLLLDSTIPCQTRLLGAVDLRILLALDAGKLYRRTAGAHVTLVKRGLIGK